MIQFIHLNIVWVFTQEKYQQCQQFFYSLQAYRDDATAVFNETLAKSTKCVDDRIEEVNDHTESFKKLVNGAVEFSNRAMEDMKNCTEVGNFVTIGSCLGSIALQTDMKVVAFTAQVGLMVRIRAT